MIATQKRYHYQNINRWTSFVTPFPFVVMSIYYFFADQQLLKSLMIDFVGLLVCSAVEIAFTKLRKPCPEPKAVFYHNNDDITLLKRLPRTNLNNPDDMVKAMHKVMKTDVNAAGFMELLKDDHYTPDVLELLRTVAATDNPNTLDAVRKAVGVLVEEREAKLEVERQRRVAELERRKEEHRQLLEAQPDYSNDIAELVRHREEQLA